jgi:M6 family metalloprotease-like protein
MPVSYDGKRFTFHNPDGSEVPVRGWGNQFAAVFETLDGFTVVPDPETGMLCYARLSEGNDEYLSTGEQVGVSDPRALTLPKHLRVTPAAARQSADRGIEAMGGRTRWQERRRRRRERQLRRSRDGGDLAEGEADEEAEPAGVVGKYVGLCLLIEFPDVPATVRPRAVRAFCNKKGYTGHGNNGSVHDYFRDVSGGLLSYTNIVTAYYTAKRKRAYYTNPKISYGTRAQQLIREALTDLKAGGFDFGPLTADEDGFIRALNVFYAGSAVNNWSEGLWPHSSALTRPFRLGGKRFSDYQITDIGDQLTLRTFCHENGHMICDFPDLYDYGYQSNGVGDFCLMCAGGSDTNPTQVCAYLKYQAGWAAEVMTAVPGTTYELRHDQNEFLLHRRNATEYFILENRQRKGRDRSLPDAGLAIWHVDELGSNDDEQRTRNRHYECSLEQADNRFDLEAGSNNGDANDLFSAPAKPRFGRATAPSSRWWDGKASGLEVRRISVSGDLMTLRTVRPAKPPTSP